MSGGLRNCVAVAASILLVIGGIRSTQAAITVNFDLGFDKADNITPVSAAVADEIRSAINAAVGVYNEWSNYDRSLYVVYHSGVATADGNINGTIRFGPGAQYRTPPVAFHEINHVLGAGTHSNWAANVDNNAKLWLGRRGITMSRQYYPDNVLKADLHIHWVGGGTLQDIEMKREGVHIMGAIRADMGLSNGNLYDLLGDFTNDGVIGVADFTRLAANMHTNISALTSAQGYLRGDMNLDRQINHSDFIAFRDAYLATGNGSFESLLAQVPEPGATLLAGTFVAALVTSGRRRAR